MMRVLLPNREIVGRFEALDPAGRLVLGLPDGAREAISAGDVAMIEGSGGSARPTRNGES
jgi:hypothetical protein